MHFLMLFALIGVCLIVAPIVFRTALALLIILAIPAAIGVFLWITFHLLPLLPRIPGYAVFIGIFALLVGMLVVHVLPWGKWSRRSTRKLFHREWPRRPMEWGRTGRQLPPPGEQYVVLDKPLFASRHSPPGELRP